VDNFVNSLCKCGLSHEKTELGFAWWLISQMLTENRSWTSILRDFVISHFRIILSFEIQILVQCWEMGRLVIGLEHLRGTRVQCGVAAWTLVLCVQHLALLIFLRMLLKSLPFIFWNSWIFINFWIPFKRPMYSSIKTIFFKTLSLSCLTMVASAKMLHDQQIMNSINLESFYNMSGVLFAENCGMHWQGMNYTLLSISILFEHAHFQR